MEEFTLARAIDWVHGARYKGQKNGLENTRALLRELGDPQEGLACVHVAGTNGKGSVCALVERALRACGKKTGLYTSPYLCEYAERVRVNGAPAEEGMLLAAILRVKAAAERLVARGVFPTTFELGTGVAFEIFREAAVDCAVIEVGLGGRFDSTNVITPAVSAIAAIGMDHMKMLGDTLEQIAFEKAGIIKPGVPVAIHAANRGLLPVFERAAMERGAPLSLAEGAEVLEEGRLGSRFRFDGREYEIHLPGEHQVQNAALAARALSLLGGIDDKYIQEGFSKARWHGRLEWVDGVLIDGAHNPQGALALESYVRKFVPGKRTFVVGMMRDKQVEACARIFSGMADVVIATGVAEARAASAEEIARCCGISARPVAGVAQALEAARAEGGTIVVCGSLYLAGEARRLLRPGEKLCL